LQKWHTRRHGTRVSDYSCFTSEETPGGTPAPLNHHLLIQMNLNTNHADQQNWVRYVHTFISEDHTNSQDAPDNYIHLILAESDDPESALQCFINSDRGLKEELDEIDASNLRFLKTHTVANSRIPFLPPSYYKISNSINW
jgi:hypothetical protein